MVDDPNNVNTTTYGPGGGTLSYVNYVSTGAQTGAFAGQSLTQAILQRTSATSYVRIFPNGAKQIFNLADTSTPTRIFMTEYDDPAGNAITYTYDPTTFRLVSVADALGQVTTLAYVSDDPATTNGDFYRVASVTDPFGRSATLAYDGTGRLSQITDMGGIVSQFSYGAGDFINTLTTPYGNTTFVSNDTGNDRTLLTTDPEGGQEYVRFVYDMTPPDNAAAVPFASGLVTQQNLNQYRTTYYWDKKAYMMAPGNFSKAHLYHFTHTSAGGAGPMSDILESEKSAYESRIYYNYPGQANAYISSDNNQPIKSARVLDDGSTQLTQFAYNAQGKMTKSVTPGNGTTPSRTTTMTYANGIDLTAVYQENAAGSSVDSFGAAADLLGSFTYDTLGRHLVVSVTDASGQTSAFTYNAYGQVLTATDALGETTTFTYDRDQEGGSGVTDGYLLTVTGPVAAATSSYQYDGFGRLYQTTDSEGYTITITYDAIGGVATKTLNRVAMLTFPDGTSNQILYNRLDPQWYQDRLGRWTETLYDNMRRPSAIVDSLNRVTQYQWCACGSLEAIIDPAGNRTSWMRDEQSRVIQKTYPDASAVFYQYENTTSRRKSVLDAKGQRVNFQYNIADAVNNISFTNAAGSPLNPPTPTVSFTYDTVYPRSLSMVDGVGTTQYTYNAIGGTPSLGAGRLATVAGPWANSTIAFTYDALGRVVGRSINGAANTASVTYDTLGRVNAVTNALGTFGYTFVDATARIAQMTYPNGQATQFQYFGNTGDQRLQEIKNQDNSGNLISQFDYTYNAVGDITTWALKNPTSANPAVMDSRQFAFGYDAADQLISGPLTDSVTSASRSDLAYRYDAAGNRVTTQNGSALVTEQPNALNQITQTSAGGMMRFAGSVNTGTAGGTGGVSQASVTVGGNPATVNPDNTFVGYAQVAPNAITRVHIVASNVAGQVTDNYVDITPNILTPNVFAYDANGNTISDGPAGAPNATYGWDAENRLVTITQGSNVTKFDYDGLGRRVRESLNGTELRHWLWCGLELCEERDATNTVTKRFYGQGEQMAGVSYYFTRDHLGSIREMTDASYVIHARYDYDLYGQRSANLITTSPVESDFGFTSHYLHANSGLYLAPYRAYNASVGRWLSRDPIEEEGGTNMYAYLLSDPVAGVDPLGLQGALDDKQAQAGGWFDENQGTLNTSTGDKAVAAGQQAVQKGINDSWSYWEIILGIFTRTRTKSICLPSESSLQVDMQHILSGHVSGGSRVSNLKTLFPSNWTPDKIERVIRDAYKCAKRLQTQGDRVMVMGQSNGLNIEMWVNTATKIIETAYPVP